MKESFKLSKLKHDLRHIKQSPDETHSMYLERFQNLETQVKTEESKVKLDKKYSDMISARKKQEFEQTLIRIFGGFLGSGLICFVLFLLFKSC